MKRPLLTCSLTLTASLCGLLWISFPERVPAESGATTGDSESAESVEIDPTPYTMERYGKVLSKSPFDFDVPPAPPVIPPPPMQGWLLSGLRVTTEFTSVTIVEEKTGARVSLYKYTDPAIAANDRPRSAPGSQDKFVLDRVEFEPDKPKGRKTASAFIRRNSEEAAPVKWEAKVDQMRPTGGVPNIAIPQQGTIQGQRGMLPQGVNPVIPQPGVTAPNPINTLPQIPGQQPQQAIPGLQAQPQQQQQQAQPQGNVTGGQAALLNLLNRQNSNSGTNTAGAQPSASNPMQRRRVVLPSPEPPPPPAATP